MKLLFLEPPQAKIYQYQFPCVFSSYNAVVLFCASFTVKNQFPHSKRRETIYATQYKTHTDDIQTTALIFVK